MGIQGLLPLLKSIQVDTHLSEFKGKKFAVDAYVWLHRGAYACAPQLVKGEPTTKYVDYIMHRVRMMRHYGVEPYLVFDGGPLPAKKGTETDRAKKREETLSRANQLTQQGLHSQARDLFVKCVDVTPAMAYQVIKALKVENVSYVVAPYEADAQLAYLELNDMVDGIITEDSDLLVFACKHVLFKLDSDGNCVSIKRERLGSVVDAPMSGWGDKEFREMAILSGCDYLPSVVGLGLKTAHKFLRKYKTVEKVLQFIRLESNMKLPPGYLNALRQAELAFQHQRVYDPRLQRLVFLRPIGEDVAWDETKDAYVGMDIEPEIARGIAEGDIEPTTLLPIEDINIGFKPKPSSSMKRGFSERNANAKKFATVGSPPEKGTLKDFFSVLPKSRPAAPIDLSHTRVLPSTFPKKAPRATGANSGMRTLSEQMDMEREQKTSYIVVSDEAEDVRTAPTTSRFFTSNPPPGKRKREDHEVMTTPRNPRRVRSSLATTGVGFGLEGKENEMPPLSPLDPVMQEDGYISPMVRGNSVVDVSSPIDRLSIVGNESMPMSQNRGQVVDESFIGGKMVKGGGEREAIPDDDISSPVTELTLIWQVGGRSRVSYSQAAVNPRTLLTESPTKRTSGDSAILVHSTPSPSKPSPFSPLHPCGVDLRDGFQDDISSEGFVGLDTPGLDDEIEAGQDQGGSDNWDDHVDYEVDVDIDVEEIGEDSGGNDDVQRVMLGWRKLWSHTATTTATGRSRQASKNAPPPSIPTACAIDDEDTFGPPHSSTTPASTIPLRFISQVSSSSSSRFNRRGPLTASHHLQARQPRRSLPAKEELQPLQAKKAGRASLGTLLTADEVEDVEEVAVPPPSQRLQQFR
ncbi:Rad2 nuclease [Tulasnella sp. 330]|nr:Rad2 nuclease [Tulasnella sp. 330]